jgi:tetratricopeptide (TPR) repeat protein/predicted Ser/Thr protein kinase
VDDLSKPPTRRDSLDVILREAVAAPSVLLPDAVIGEHYQIERVLGMGGMGTVYLARDLDLGRPVAIKVHRMATDSSRLHREAVAMARLAHPNVVTVFEVGDYEGHPFVAMEYIEGDTLRAWAGGGARSSGEILEVLLAAGTGLAAAHDAELVHRDVKPDNILIGRDGRVRIGDFGLAQAAEAGEPLRVPLGDETATGTVIGTPAYMAPEQIDGGTVDARSDQFAFCVAAWELLCGERPFAGEDTVELRAAIQRGAPVPPRRSVPSSLRQILLRGLAVDPAKRWASMPALLRALRSARRRRRVMIGVLTALAVAAPVVAWAAWPGPDPVIACDTRASTLEIVVPPAAVAALVASVEARPSPTTSHPLSTPLAAILAGHFVRATAVTDTACRAEITRKWSADMVAASRECTLDHATAVREVLASVSPTRVAPSVTVLAALDLPPIEPCADPRVLAAWRRLAPDPQQLTAVVELRARIERALTQLGTGQVAEARTALNSIAAAPLFTDRAVHGRAELLRAKLEVASGDYLEAERNLEAAYLAARSGEDASLALRLVSELIYVTASLRRDPIAGDRWVTEGIADAKREQGRYPGDAASVYEAAAAAAVLAGDGETALERCAISEKLLDGVNPRLHARLMSIRSSALADLGRMTEAIEDSDRDLRNLRMSFGMRHPQVASALGDRAALMLEMGRTAEAAEAASEAISIMDAATEDQAAGVTALQISVGATLLHVGNPAGKKYLDRARADRVAEFGEDHPDVALIDTNLALTYLDAGDPARALTTLRHAVAVQERVLGPDHLELAVALFNLAVAERTSKDYVAAAATARRVAAIYERRQRGTSRHVLALDLVAQIENVAGHPELALAAAEAGFALPPVDDPQAGAWGRIEAARALIALGRDAPRARRLLAEARAAYALVNMTARVAEADALLAKLP